MSAELYPFAFEGEIVRHGVGAARQVFYRVLFLPDALAAALPFKAHPRLRFEGEVAEQPIAAAWIPAGGGRWYAILSPDLLKAADAKVGDIVEMRFRVDDQNRVDAPQELLDAIAADAEGAAELWSAATPGAKRALAQLVGSARTAPTRAKRVAKALDVLHGRAALRSGRPARRG